MCIRAVQCAILAAANADYACGACNVPGARTSGIQRLLNPARCQHSASFTGFVSVAKHVGIGAAGATEICFGRPDRDCDGISVEIGHVTPDGRFMSNHTFDADGWFATEVAARLAHTAL